MASPLTTPQAQPWIVEGGRDIAEPGEPVKAPTCWHCEPRDDVRRWLRREVYCERCNLRPRPVRPAYSHERLDAALRFYQDRQAGKLERESDVGKLIEKADLEIAIRTIAEAARADGKPLLSDLELEVVVKVAIQGQGVAKVAAELARDRSTIWRAKSAAVRKLYKWLNYRLADSQDLGDSPEIV